MADPVSLAASIVALIHATRVSGRGLATLKSYYRAPAEIIRLTAEVKGLEQLLEDVHSFVQSNGQRVARHTYGTFKSPLDLADARVQSINTILTSPAFGLKRLSDANRARATLIRYKSRLATLEREVRESVQDIGVRLSLVTARAAGQIDDKVDIFLKFQETFSNNLVVSFQQVAINQFEAAAVKALEQYRPDMTPLSAGQRQLTSSPSRALLPSSNEQEDCSTRPQSAVFKKKFDCRPGCTCLCHIKRSCSSPWLMKSLLGELNVYWRSKKAGIRCNCSGHTGIAIIYRFPQFLIHRYISMVMQTTMLDGPELVLRVPRVLPWTHLLWRYSVCGDLIAIKRMYADRIASPYDVDPSGRNALLYASKQQSAQVADFLLKQGADSNQPDMLGKPPSEALLRRAFGGMYGSEGPSIQRHILKDDESMDEFGFTTIHKIILGFVHKPLRDVLEATTDTVNWTDSLGRSALFWAVIRDDALHVELLLNSKADPNLKDARGSTPIDFVRGPSVCKLLLDAGAILNVNPQHWDHSSIHEHVIEHGNPDVISLFKAADFDIDAPDHDNETPLLNAIYAGNYPVVARLVDLGADVNRANISSRDSALHFATAFDRPAVVKLLLEHQADYNALDCNGRTIAHVAARSASTELVKVLASANLASLDLSLKDREGRVPGDYMNDRIILTDMEVGVHEAWEELVDSVSSPGEESNADNIQTASEVAVETVVEVLTQEVLSLDPLQELAEGNIEQTEANQYRIPGAFPSTLGDSEIAAA